MDNNDFIKKISKAKEGDKEAMEEIVKRFTPLIINTALKTYIKFYEMEDLIQVGKMSVIKAVNMFDVSKSAEFTGYVTNAVRKNFYYLIRKGIKENYCCSLNTANDEGYELIDSIASEENLEEEMVMKEYKAALKKALKLLPEKEREIIYYYYFLNKKLCEYAEEKGIGYRTAVERKKRAVEKLKNMLKERKYYASI